MVGGLVVKKKRRQRTTSWYRSEGIHRWMVYPYAAVRRSPSSSLFVDLERVKSHGV